MNDFNLIIKLCGSKKSRFARDEEASGLVLGYNSPFNKIPVLGAVF